jgi:hypothetical protein
MLLLLSSLDHRGSCHLLMLSGRREASVNSRDCRLARGEAELNKRAAAIRSYRRSSLGYATTKHSELPSVRTASRTAYRTTAISTDSFTSSPPLCRFRYRRPKLDYLTPLEQRDPLQLLVKSRRNIELNHSCHGEPPMCFLSTSEERQLRCQRSSPSFDPHSAERGFACSTP